MAYSEAFEEAAQYFLNIEEEQEEKSNGLIDQIMPLPDSGEVMGEEGKKALTAAIACYPKLFNAGAVGKYCRKLRNARN